MIWEKTPIIQGYRIKVKTEAFVTVLVISFEHKYIL